ncbi:MAG TPA: ABC transporter ATP-binding protein [Bryobacteraceae bacterium]|nr:ABC transporter ATP-binding protein [Bryobacteraceae bacterium]HPT27072.1 ABC transporter ATP-binding protein [Bryobacteraceae bacterium]
MIKVEGLTKRYDRFEAVRGIDFEVEKGQIVGFLGPNGAGKTTTMRILTCFMPPTEGKASVAGFDVMTQSMEVKRRIGYLPETPPLYPEMEVEEYLAFVGRLKGLPVADIPKKVKQVSERCAVADVSKKLISKLSKGYRQRVGLAQAILHNPEVLVLDEPTAGLDPKQIHETRELIRSLAGEHTIILSTHILPEVEQTCDHVVIISKGKLVAKDSVQNLTSRLRGQETVSVEIGGGADPAAVRQSLENVPGVSQITAREERGRGLIFEIESLAGRNTRAAIARAVVNAGWELNELKTASVSLEEIFLELTSPESGAEPESKKV